MRMPSRTFALFAWVTMAACAAPLDEAPAESEAVDAGADARRPSPQDAGGSGGSGGGGGSGGTGGSGGGDDLDAGDDVDLDADLDAALDPDAAEDPDAGEVCLPDDAVIDPECGLCGDPLFGCMLGCLIVDCPNDSTMMCNELCQCAPTPPLCSDLADGGVDDDASAPDADIDGGFEEDAGFEDADIDDGGELDGSFEDADIDDGGELDGSFEDAEADDADVADAEPENP